MEAFETGFGRGIHPPFEAVRASNKRCVFGVDYAHFRGHQNGDLFVTRWGWPILESLFPKNWFVGEPFTKTGRVLAGSTGAVFRVEIPHPARGQVAVVVKFSRVAQEMRLPLTGSAPGCEPAAFLSPFEEFGRLSKLKSVARLTLPTKAPLAIYSPPTRYLSSQLHRLPELCQQHSQRLEADQAGQAAPVRYDWERLYILLYRWMDGLQAEEAVERGWLTESAARKLCEEVGQQLEKWGWRVLDHRPRHLILRPCPQTGRLRQRRGRPLCGMVDYELLYPLRSV